MAGTFLNFPFDEDIFKMYWEAEPDLVKTELLNSGAMVEDASIAQLIANGSDTYTAPFYKLLNGSAVNYDGKTDITTVEASGDSASGVVFGRAMGFAETEFVRAFNSGANPMQYIASRVAPSWNHFRQKTLLGILGAVAGVPAISSHVIAKDAAIEETTLGDATVKALGDNADSISLAFMHSAVANKLANMEILKYAVYTDAQGIERQNRKIAYVNGLLVIVDDNAPMTAATSGTSAKPATYTTYMLGSGFIRHAAAPVPVSVEVARDPAKNGGMNYLYTRIRETIHPNGFSFAKPKSGYTSSPTDAQLADKANWSLKAEAKSVPFVAVTTQV